MSIESPKIVVQNCVITNSGMEKLQTLVAEMQARNPDIRLTLEYCYIGNQPIKELKK